MKLVWLRFVNAKKKKKNVSPLFRNLYIAAVRFWLVSSLFLVVPFIPFMAFTKFSNIVRYMCMQLNERLRFSILLANCNININANNTVFSYITYGYFRYYFHMVWMKLHDYLGCWIAWRFDFGIDVIKCLRLFLTINLNSP